MFYLLGMKQSGWLSKTGQYSSSLADAAIFPSDEAFLRIKKHREASNILIPVRVEDMA